MEREDREFEYTNEDGEEGVIRLSFGPWGHDGDSDAPIMLFLEDGCWMGIEEAETFLRWLRVALPEAKRKHVPR